MPKTDFKKTMKELFKPGKDPVKVDVPEINFLMVDGKGNPNTSKEFTDAIEALYPVAYALKFMVKKADPKQDYVVPPLQGLWWAEDMDAFATGNKDDWLWTLMVMHPPQVTVEMVEDAIGQVRKKKNPPALGKLRFEAYHEGLSAQLMHTGPYSKEGPNIQRLHDFITESGHKNRGKHHEIYLSDFRKTAPEKMKTVIRQPME